MKTKRHIRLIVHDIRSCHNVGSLLRTADGIGVEHVYLCGYTPYPQTATDERLPHIAQKLTGQIHKTALGAENSVEWSQQTDINIVLRQLKQSGFTLAGLEQAPHSVPLPDYHFGDKVAVLLGREVEGIESGLMQQMDAIVEIPMYGSKESFNVVQAAAMVLYQLRFGA